MGDRSIVAQSYVDALNRRDWRDAVDHFEKDAEIWIAGQTMGLDGLQQAFETVGGGFVEGPKIEVFNIFEADDRVALEMRVAAKTASGKDYRNQYALMFVIKNGKIAKLNEYLDTVPATAALS